MLSHGDVPTSAPREEGPSKSRHRFWAVLAAVIGLGCASYQAYRNDLELIKLVEALAKWPVDRIRKEKEFQQQLDRIEKKLQEIEEEAKASTEKIERAEGAGRAVLGKIDKLLRAWPQGSNPASPAGQAPSNKFPPITGFPPFRNAIPDM